MLINNDIEKDSHPKKHRQRGKNRKIGFSSEIITKDTAKVLLTQEKSKSTLEEKHEIYTPEVEFGSSTDNQSSKSTVKKRKNKLTPSEKPVQEKKRKKTKAEKSVEENVEEQTNDAAEDSTETVEKPGDKPLSKRALKKLKYEKVLEEKKIQVDSVLQQKALNYLSKWKHDRSNWKFEKLRQVWLLKNMYNPDKIEETFWDTLVEYFGSSKGKTHETILKDAIKIVENESSEVGDVKLKRARDIVQNLNEN